MLHKVWNFETEKIVFIETSLPLIFCQLCNYRNSQVSWSETDTKKNYSFKRVYCKSYSEFANIYPHFILYYETGSFLCENHYRSTNQSITEI